MLSLLALAAIDGEFGSVVSCIANCVISGGGALISFFLASYIEAGKGYQDIVNLITVPTLSMGLGNLIFVPLALAIGRRPVYLGSLVLLVCGSIIASQNTNYEYHLAIRVVLGFAAGQVSHHKTVTFGKR